jgi:hypothetical protein
MKNLLFPAILGCCFAASLETTGNAAKNFFVAWPPRHGKNDLAKAETLTQGVHQSITLEGVLSV